MGDVIGPESASACATLCPRAVEVAVGGEVIVVQPLVLRDFKLIGDRVAGLQGRLAAVGDLGKVPVLELAPLALAELPEVLALALRRRAAEGLQPVEAQWLESAVPATVLLELIDAVIAVNDLPGILKNWETLRRRVQAAPAGR